MTVTQGHIDFELHTHENNYESETSLTLHKKVFSKQCKIIYDAMMEGEVLTSLGVAEKYHITDLRRRICDLTEKNGVKVEKDFLYDEQGNRTRFKKYWIKK